jgi:hypothetical protein
MGATALRLVVCADRDVARVCKITDRQYGFMKALCPHDADVSVEAWTVFLSRVMGRQLTEDEAVDIITEYNERLRAEYADEN